nr:hypothetical protein [Pseudobdellovibrionaceae bacterium]
VLQAPGYKESLSKIQSIPELVKTNVLSENQGKIVLKVAAKEYFENSTITDEGKKAETLAEAIMALNEEKIVENLTDLLGLEMQFEAAPNQYKKMDRLFQVLNRVSIANQLMNPKKDRFLIEVLILIQNREMRERQFVDDLKSAQLYFENRIKLISSEPYQLLEGYSLLNQLTTNKKWITQQFAPVFNHFDLASLDRHAFIETFKSCITGLNQLKHTYLLSEIIFKNAQYLLSSRIQILSELEGDKSQHLQDLIQSLDLVNYFFDQDNKNLSISNIQSWDSLLVDNSKLNEQIKNLLIKNSESLNSLKFQAKHILTQAVLFKVLSDKKIKLVQEDSKIYSQYLNHKINLLEQTKEVSSNQENKINLASYRKYFTYFESLKNYLTISPLLSEGKVIPKGRIVEGKIINSDEQNAKIYAEKILTKSLNILYQNNLEIPNIKNCLMSQNQEELQQKSEVCKDTNGNGLNYSLVSKMFLSEQKEELKHISLAGEGTLYIPAGRFTAPAKSTLEINYPEIEFHPLAKIEIISGNININTSSIINAYLDVSAVDQNQFGAEINKGSAPKIIRFNTPLADSFTYHFVEDAGSARIQTNGLIIEKEFWESVNSKNQKTEILEKDFKNINALLGGSFGFDNPEDTAEAIERNKIDQNFFPGELPKITVTNIPKADSAGNIRIKISESKEVVNSSNVLAYVEGGNGVNGENGIPSVLCNKDETDGKEKYKPYLFILGNEEQHYIVLNRAQNYVAPPLNRYKIVEAKLFEIMNNSNISIQLAVKKDKTLVKRIESISAVSTKHVNQKLTHVYRYSVYQIDMPGAAPTSGGTSGDGGSVVIKTQGQQVDFHLFSYVSPGIAGKGGKPAEETCRAPGEVQLQGTDGQTGIVGTVEDQL